MKSIKAFVATLALGIAAVLGTSGCAGPQYAQVPGEPLETAFQEENAGDWVGHVDYISLSSGKAWPASAQEYVWR